MPDPDDTDDDTLLEDMRALGQAATDGDEDTAAEIADKYKK